MLLWPLLLIAWLSVYFLYYQSVGELYVVQQTHITLQNNIVLGNRYPHFHGKQFIFQRIIAFGERKDLLGHKICSSASTGFVAPMYIH